MRKVGSIEDNKWANVTSWFLFTINRAVHLCFNSLLILFTTHFIWDRYTQNYSSSRGKTFWRGVNFYSTQPMLPVSDDQTQRTSAEKYVNPTALTLAIVMSIKWVTLILTLDWLWTRTTMLHFLNNHRDHHQGRTSILNHWLGKSEY